jgi:hypothetical protein
MATSARFDTIATTIATITVAILALWASAIEPLRETVDRLDSEAKTLRETVKERSEEAGHLRERIVALEEQHGCANSRSCTASNSRPTEESVMLPLILKCFAFVCFFLAATPWLGEPWLPRLVAVGLACWVASELFTGFATLH